MCDWLLRTKTELWEEEVDSAPGSVSAKDSATGFKTDLNNLQKLADQHKGMTSVCLSHPPTLPDLPELNGDFTATSES